RLEEAMSALGQKQTCALQKRKSALPPIATAKADIRKRSCLLYPRKRTCAAHKVMSALGQKRTSAHLTKNQKARPQRVLSGQLCSPALPIYRVVLFLISPTTGSTHKRACRQAQNPTQARPRKSPGTNLWTAKIRSVALIGRASGILFSQHYILLAAPRDCVTNFGKKRK